MRRRLFATLEVARRIAVRKTVGYRKSNASAAAFEVRWWQRRISAQSRTDIVSARQTHWRGQIVKFVPSLQFRDLRSGAFAIRTPLAPSRQQKLKPSSSGRLTIGKIKGRRRYRA